MEGFTNMRKSRITYDVAKFHEKMLLKYDGPPRQLEEDITRSRIGHLQEELNEFHAALIYDKGLPEMLDALVDIVYVAIGTSYLMGLDFDEAWRRVHEANMKKIPKATKRSKIDVVKPKGWVAPDLKDLCR